MSHVLTPDQLEQVVQNTVVVLLARPDLMPGWHATLFDLMKQVQRAALDDEAIFVAAVLTLLHCPDHTLPTGTIYDRTWQALIANLQAGAIQGGAAREEAVTMDRLLGAVVQATAVALIKSPADKDDVAVELRDMRAAASEIGDPALTGWLDDVLALLEGTLSAPPAHRHQDIYAAYWNTLVHAVGRDDLGIIDGFDHSESD